MKVAEKYWKVKSTVNLGTTYREVRASAWSEYKLIKRQTKRNPYIRSTFFKRRKIFFDYFWEHLSHKPPKQRMQRLRFFNCSVELLRNSTYLPDEKEVNKEVFYRFYGVTKESLYFIVQVKKDKKDNHFLMSIFPKL